MSSSNVRVFYIGAKPLKKDNVLKRKHLVWAGYGSSQTVSAADAEVYFRYPDVWVSEDEFKKLKAVKVEVQKTAVASSAGEGAADTGSGAGDSATGAQADAGSQQVNQSGGLGELDREMLVQAAILQLKKGDPADYTAQGRPRVNRIAEIVGTNVGADEIDAAIKALKHTGKL